MKAIRWTACAMALAAWASAADPAAQQTPLTMAQAIAGAIRTNLTEALAKAQSQQARGRALQAASALLPQIAMSIGQARVFKSNLATAGFEPNPLLPDTVIGPYNVFDARLRLVQRLLDPPSAWSAKAAYRHADAARLGVDLAAEQVALAAALSYIESLRAMKSIKAAQADLELAERLAKQAEHRMAAGSAAAVDVTRADTRIAQARHALIMAKRDAVQADIRLKRVAGLPLAEPIALTDPAGPLAAPAEPKEALLSLALQERVELRITEAELSAEKAQLAAAKAGFLPSVDAFGDYGHSGNLPSGSARTGAIGVRLELPIFEGRRTMGQIREASGRLSAAEKSHSDATVQVEEDIRLALETLSAELDELDAAETEVRLAEREVQLAEARFGAGVGDNIQVVSAQSSLAQARQLRTDAWARLVDAEAGLAVARGRMRTFSF